MKKQRTFYVDDETYKNAILLAELNKISLSTLVRILINESYDRGHIFTPIRRTLKNQNWQSLK